MDDSGENNIKSGNSLQNWFKYYFGPDYLKIDIQRNTKNETVFLWNALDLKPGMKLLDVACGYGRHLLPLQNRGIGVYGIDLSMFMLKKAQTAAKRKGMDLPRVLMGDMRSLPFKEAFDSASCMFNSFGYFESEEDNFRSLISIGQALKPGGYFLLDLTNRDYYLRNLVHKEWFENHGVYILEKKWFDSLKNRSEIDVTVIDKHGKRDYHHSIRLYSYSELVMLLRAAGFEVHAVFGGFEGEEFNLNHKRMLVLSQRLEKDSL